MTYKSLTVKILCNLEYTENYHYTCVATYVVTVPLILNLALRAIIIIM